jgi:hypothetical protein
VSEQYRRIVSAIEYTLDQLRRGPKGKDAKETAPAYERRLEAWYIGKHKFALYAIRCLKTLDAQRAEGFLCDLRQLGDEI